MNKTLLHCLDLGCVSLGGALMVVDALNATEAVAALVGTPLGNGPLLPVLTVLGLFLACLPLTRRVLGQSLQPWRDSHEMHDLKHALTRIALQQRLQAANLYLADMDEAGLRRIFAQDGDLQSWMAPVLLDPALKAQLSTKLLRRLEPVSA